MQQEQTIEATAPSETYPKYFVTYTVMNKEAEANLFGHASLIMSVQQSVVAPIEVIDAVGFYSSVKEPSTQDRIIRSLKKWLGFRMDLQAVHGHIEHEQLRFLDGPGIQGISFQTSEEKFNQLVRAYTNAIINEEITSKKRNKQIKVDPMLGGTLAQNAHVRNVLENAQAMQEDRDPLFNDFHVTAQWSRNIRKPGLTTENSYTCKTRALAFLHDAGIINDDIRKKIYGGQFKFAFPRFSGLPLTPIQLVSTGELQPFVIPAQKQKKKSESLKTVYSRAWNCCLITMPNPPIATNIPKLSAAYSSYYVQVASRQDVLYLIDRTTQTITELPVEAEHQQAFKEQLDAMAKNKPLFNDELDIIRASTGHQMPERTRLYWTGLPKTYPSQWPVNKVNYQDNQYHLVRSTLIKITKMERALLAKINAYKKDRSSGEHYESLVVQLKRIAETKKVFRAYENNQDKHNLKLNLDIAKNRLRTARMILNPEQLNYGFIDRVLTNVALHKALLGLVVVLIAATSLIGVVGVIATVSASMYSGFQFWKAYKAEDEIFKMHDAYHVFDEWRKKPESEGSTSEPDSDSDTPVTPVFAA